MYKIDMRGGAEEEGDAGGGSKNRFPGIYQVNKKNVIKNNSFE